VSSQRKSRFKLMIIGAALCAALTSFACADDLPDAPSPQPVPAQRPEQPTHRFFDAKNSLALGALAAGLTGDALSTQKGLSYPGIYEVNPVARPFVQTRAGAAVYSAGGFALLSGGMYLAHKTQHHKLERIFPFAIAGWEGFLTWHNYRQISRVTAAR
jgi:hypothetical protein